MFAFLNGYHLILLEGREPLPYETLRPQENFDALKFPNHTEEWLLEDNSFSVVGNESSKLFDHIVYIHSLSGLVISQNGAIQFLEIFSDDKKCEVYTENGVLTYHYDELHLFQLENVLGVPINDQENNTIILDWFSVKSGKSHDYRFGTIGDSNLYFHTHDGTRDPRFKDVLLQKVVKSGEEVLEHNMTFTHKLDIEEHMSSVMGIQGYVYSDTYIQPIIVEPKERQLIKRISGTPILSNSEKFYREDYYDIYLENIENLSGYNKKIIESL
jgi:hypothetical protein